MAKITREDALRYHSEGKPGKIEVVPTKPYSTQTDLSLAYSPGVAEPCLEIKDNPHDAYEYTAKGNLVAVISNGTAVLGLGKLEANNPEAIDRVKRAISDTDLQVQIEGLKVAGTMNAKALLNSILESLSSKNKWVRMAAVEALKDYDDARVDRSLNLLASTDKDYAVRSTIKQVVEYRENKKPEAVEETKEVKETTEEKTE